MVTPEPEYEPARLRHDTLAQLNATRAREVASLFDDIGKKKGVKKCARKLLAELLAYAGELELRSQLRPVNPPS